MAACHRTIQLNFSDQVLDRLSSLLSAIINLEQDGASRAIPTVIGAEGREVSYIARHDWMKAFIRPVKAGTRRTLTHLARSQAGADVGRSDACSKKLIH